MTRLAYATWRSGPGWKRGYGGTSWLPMSYKEGEVKHSAEGGLAAAFGVLDSPHREASWHFTLPKQGPVRYYQHYELEDICWHCGVPGDERHDTSYVGNITLIGSEHEGVAGEPLTPWQVENTILLSRELRKVLPNYGNQVLQLRRNLWEHGWLSNTSCPSGRIPWQPIIAALVEEVDMPLTAADLQEIRKVIREELNDIQERCGVNDAGVSMPSLKDLKTLGEQTKQLMESHHHP